MTKTDLSTEALLVRREIAEKATPGPWKPDEPFEVSRHIKAITGDGPTDYVFLAWICPKPGEMGTHEQKANDASHIAANSPDVVIATIDELLRLRAELEQYKDSIQSLRYVANKTLVDCNFRIQENISLKEEVLRIQAENVNAVAGEEAPHTKIQEKLSASAVKPLRA